MANSYVYEHGTRFERAEQPIEIVQEFPVLMEVPELGKLLQMRDPQGLTRDLRKIVAKAGMLHFDVLLANQHVTGVCVEFSRNGRQRDGGGDLLQDLLEGLGWWAVERAILAGRRGDPAELAATVVFLAGRASGYITGQTLAVDGGISIT